MDISQILMHPGFFVPLALSAVALIVWLVRLEGKNSSQAAAIERIEKTHKLEMERLDKEIERLSLELKVHITNQDVHFHKGVADAYEQRDDYRFKTMENGIEFLKTSMADTHRKLNLMAGRE